MSSATLFSPKGARYEISRTATFSYSLPSVPVVAPIHSPTCARCDVVIPLFFVFFLNQSLGAKPDESPGDPAARVLALH